jgi:hypothetical protein
MLSNGYARAGSFTVTVTVADDDETGVGTATVTVLSARQGIQLALSDLQAIFAAGRINTNAYNVLRARLTGALATAQAGQLRPTVQQLTSFQSLLTGYENAGTIPPADAAALRSLVGRILVSIQRS